MSQTTEAIELPRLYVDSLDSKPQSFSWDVSKLEGYGDDEGVIWKFWETVEPDDGDDATCAKCYEPIQYNGDAEEWVHAGQDTPSASCDDDDCEPYAEPDDEYNRDKGCEGPMMNYWYPVEIRHPEEAARAISHLPLCVVEVDGETGLALTGGGMDLSWEICEAFVCVGSYPPFHFAAQLPKMANRFTDKHRLVIAACRETVRIMQGWTENAATKLDDIEKWYLDREAAGE